MRWPAWIRNDPYARPRSELSVGQIIAVRAKLLVSIAVGFFAAAGATTLGVPPFLAFIGASVIFYRLPIGALVEARRRQVQRELAAQQPVAPAPAAPEPQASRVEPDDEPAPSPPPETENTERCFALFLELGRLWFRDSKPDLLVWMKKEVASAQADGLSYSDFLKNHGEETKWPTTLAALEANVAHYTNPLLDLTPELRARHVYAIGKSGTGKTTLLMRLILENFARGDGCTFIDPHGDAATALLDYVPADRVDDVIYFDPTRPSSPAFNLFALPYSPAKLTDDVVSIFKLLTDSWGHQLEHILANATTTLLTDTEPHSLADLRTLLTVPPYRDAIVARVKNEQLRAFWAHEWPTLPKGAANAILNKLSMFLRPTSDLERVFSERTNGLDFSRIMDDGRILIVNLSKGTLGEEASRFLGALFASAIQQAALARATTPEHQRRPHYFYVDEFQNYATDSFATILSEARKYRLALTLANQTTGQLPASLWQAITGNVATLVAFQVSADDASRLTREMHKTEIVRTARDQMSGDEIDIATAVASIYEESKELYDFHDRRGFPQMYPGIDYSNRYDEPQSMGYKWRVEAEREMPKLQRILDACTAYHENGSLSGLRHHVKGYDWREDTREVPSVSDLCNLQPLTAYVRIERVENVSRVTVTRAATPEHSMREAILARAFERARPVETPPAPSSPTVEPENDARISLESDATRAVDTSPSPTDEPAPFSFKRPTSEKARRPTAKPPA